MNAETSLRGANEIPVGSIVESAWNTHVGDKDPEAESLKRSIRETGMVQRLVVRPVKTEDGEEAFEIVDGHRRFRAAKSLGMETVPCEVRTMSDAEAQAATLAANIQRLDNDPLLEAALIGKMRDESGWSVREIAAALGKTEVFVTRRARLLNLTAAWRSFAKRVECSVDMLERVAAHEAELQDRVASEVGLDEYEPEADGPVGFDEFEDVFLNAIRRLDPEACPFPVSECEKCQFNTATHKFLFPEFAQDGEGRCQNPACFAKKWNGAVDAMVSTLRCKRIEVKEVKDRWSIPEYWNAMPRKERKNTVPYLYETSGLKHLEWSIPKPAPAATALASMTPEERAAAKERKAREKRIRAVRDTVRDWLADEDWCDKAFNGSKAGKAAYDKMAADWMDRSLHGGWISDLLVDCMVRNCSGLLGDLPKDDLEEYVGSLAEQDRADAEGGAE